MLQTGAKIYVSKKNIYCSPFKQNILGLGALNLLSEADDKLSAPNPKIFFLLT